MHAISHSFNVDLATKYGVYEAILIQNFQTWIRHNKKLKRNLHEGRTFSYQTIEEISSWFPYWTIEQVREIINKLLTGKTRKSKNKKHEPVLMQKNFNKNKYDRTLWYAFIDEKSFVPQHLGDLPNGKGQPPKPIPYTKTYTKPSLTLPYTDEEERAFLKKMQDLNKNPNEQCEAYKSKVVNNLMKPIYEEREREKLCKKETELNKLKAEALLSEAAKFPANFKGRVKMNSEGAIIFETDKGSCPVYPIQKDFDEQIQNWRV